MKRRGESDSEKTKMKTAKECGRARSKMKREGGRMGRRVRIRQRGDKRKMK